MNLFQYSYFCNFSESVDDAPESVANVVKNNNEEKTPSGSNVQSVPGAMIEIETEYIEGESGLENEINHDESYDLFNACKEADLEKLQNCDHKLLNTIHPSGETPAYTTASNGNFEILAFLTKLGADLNLPSQNGHTPAHAAASAGHVKCFEWCYYNGCDIGYTTKEGESCLDLAQKENHVDIIASFQTLSKPRVQHAWTHQELKVVLGAARDGWIQELKKYVCRGAPVECTPNGFQTPLYQAAAHGHKECVEFLLQEGSQVNRADAGGFTAAHVSAQHGRLECLQVLTAYGADIEMENPQRMTCLRLARRAKQDDCVRWLQEALPLSPNARKALLNFGPYEADGKYLNVKLQKYENILTFDFKARQSRYKGYNRKVNWDKRLPGRWGMQVSFQKPINNWRITVENPTGQAAQIGVKSGMKVISVNNITLTSSNRDILKELIRKERCSVPVVCRFRDTLPLHRHITWFCLFLFIAFAVLCEYIMWESIEWKSGVIADHYSQARCWNQYQAAGLFPSEEILFQHCACFIESCGCDNPHPFYNCGISDNASVITTNPTGGDCVLQGKLENLDCSSMVVSMKSGFTIRFVGGMVTTINIIMFIVLCGVIYHTNMVVYRGVEVLRSLQTLLAACAGFHWLLSIVAITESYIAELRSLGEYKVFQEVLPRSLSTTLGVCFIITIASMSIAFLVALLSLYGLIKKQTDSSYPYRKISLVLLATPPVICFFCVTIALNHIRADALTLLYALGLPACGFLIFFSLSSMMEWIHVQQKREIKTLDDFDDPSHDQTDSGFSYDDSSYEIAVE